MTTRALLASFCMALALYSVETGVSAPTAPPEDVTADVDCREIGRLSGDVEFRYDVTLNNNTDRKLIVEYTVIFVAGSVRKKEYRHSTVLIPKESSVESHDGTIKEADWDAVTRFRVEWSWRDAK
jgi:hypothetical protein